jgi:ElaB/YqjD/DUF883 family membrane-anchored ribosome-binding protein
MTGIMWSNSMNFSNKGNYQDLDDLFGTETTKIPEPVEVIEVEILPATTTVPAVPVVVESTGNDIEDDYNVARKKLNELIDTSQKALEGMLNVALASDSPRAYEVVGQLIKTTGDTAKDLMDLQARKKKVLQDDNKKSQQIDTQNNIIFSGSTQDLLKALKAEKAKVIEHDS